MSSNAALAAAKRRRNISYSETTSIPRNTNSTNVNSSQSNLNTNSRALKGPVTPYDLITNHDKRLFDIELKLDSNDIFVTKTDLDSLTLNSRSNIDNTTINKLDTNIKEMTQLKNTITKQTKTVQDINSLVTTLRATVLSQTAELNELKQLKLDFAEFIKDRSQNNNLVQSTAESDNDSNNQNSDNNNNDNNKNMQKEINTENNDRVTLQVIEQ